MQQIECLIEHAEDEISEADEHRGQQRKPFGEEKSRTAQQWPAAVAGSQIPIS
ncbi:MAG: hypothetical protein WDN28_15345 [Chthoniobacter sp.]